MTDTQETANTQPLDEAAYLAARQSYDAAELEVSGRYDKWILTLAGGALGLSITFIEKIAANPSSQSLIWLKLAWAFLVAALLAALISLITSQSAIRENRAELDSANTEGRPPRLSFPRWFTRLTNFLNWASLTAFIAGVIFLCVFSFKNIDSQPQEKGAQTHAQGQTNTTK